MQDIPGARLKRRIPRLTLVLEEMMVAIKIIVKQLSAVYHYERFLDTGEFRFMVNAERLAFEVGQMESGGVCPLMFKGKPNLEREWASGKGEEFFAKWVMRRRRNHGGLNAVA